MHGLRTFLILVLTFGTRFLFIWGTAQLCRLSKQNVFLFLFFCFFLNCAATPATTSIQLHSVSVCLSLSPCLCQSVCLSPSLSFSLSDGVCMHECFSGPSLHPTPLSPCVTSNTCKIVIVSTGLTVMYMSDLQWLLRTESMKRPRHRCVQHKYTLVVVVVIVVTM